MPKLTPKRYSRPVSAPIAATASASTRASVGLFRVGVGVVEGVVSQSAAPARRKQMAVLAFMATHAGDSLLRTSRPVIHPARPHAPIAMLTAAAAFAVLTDERLANPWSCQSGMESCCARIRRSPHQRPSIPHKEIL